MAKKTTAKPSIKSSTSKKTYATYKAAEAARLRAEKKAECASASRRQVYQVVKIAKDTYIVASTPWAYRLQAEGRGTVMSVAA